MNLRQKSIQKVGFLLLAVSLTFNLSCKDKGEATTSELETTTTIAQEKGMNLANLLGTWTSGDQQFSLYNDGSVGQQNMKELELKDWTLEETDLVFARKNSKGEQTEMNQERYKILNLTAQELTLEKEGNTVVFQKQ